MSGTTKVKLWVTALTAAMAMNAGSAADQPRGDIMKNADGPKTGPISFDGKSGQEWKEAARVQLKQAMTVSAWIRAEDIVAERMQTIVSKWMLKEKFNAFDAFDAGKTDGLDTTGFLGAVFDGRYIYFVPQHDATRRHGRVLRYDTHAPFMDEKSWQGYDAEKTSGLTTRGFYGAAFDGAYIYFTPRTDGTNYHTRVLRYDTRRPFKEGGSWSAFDVGLNNSYQGCAFDGRFVYFAPGKNEDNSKAQGWPAPALRYDITKPFDQRSSYEVFELTTLPGLEPPGDAAAAREDKVDLDGIAFDGRYLYYAPIIGKRVVRFDTTKPFTEKSSWKYFRPEGLNMCVGPVFDGRFVYFGPYKQHDVVRYDISGDFEKSSSWSRLNLKEQIGAPYVGYDGGFYDGRFVYFTPFIDWSPGTGNLRMKFHGIVSRYDTLQSFSDKAAWRLADASEISGLKTVGYNAGASDGRYLYFAPWHDGVMYEKTEKICGHGRVLRYDTAGTDASYILRLTDYGHNGGLCAALPGATFTINTDRGVFSARANRIIAAGRHHLAGVYDGQAVMLYIDGKMVNRQPARGALCANSTPVTLGKIANGAGFFNGTIESIQLLPVALNDGQIADIFKSGRK
ncbi:MAG: hypothetical protein PHW60_06270 [Kiritimatiellae bacterium]|nr:hypothetical protein [Kiritimatiellia bacterium]